LYFGLLYHISLNISTTGKKTGKNAGVELARTGHTFNEAGAPEIDVDIPGQWWYNYQVKSKHIKPKAETETPDGRPCGTETAVTAENRCGQGPTGHHSRAARETSGTGSPVTASCE